MQAGWGYQGNAALQDKAFWADPDVRWLAGINESCGNVYLNKEQFEELLCWLQLAALVALPADPAAQAEGLKQLEQEMALARQCVKQAGFELDKFLDLYTETPGKKARQTLPSSAAS